MNTLKKVSADQMPSDRITDIVERLKARIARASQCIGAIKRGLLDFVLAEIDRPNGQLTSLASVSISEGPSATAVRLDDKIEAATAAIRNLTRYPS